jgi:hypothetical protein
MNASALVALAAVSALALGAAPPAQSSNDPIAIEVSPRNCVAPCNVRLLVRIAPNEANRRVTITAESDEFGRSTSRTLDGDRSPAIYELILRDLEAGIYEVQVSVDRASDSPTRRSSQFSVRGDIEDDRDPADGIGRTRRGAAPSGR